MTRAGMRKPEMQRIAELFNRRAEVNSCARGWLAGQRESWQGRRASPAIEGYSLVRVTKFPLVAVAGKGGADIPSAMCKVVPDTAYVV